MIYNWFKLFNYNEFLATELTSRTIVAVLEGYGTATILVSRGNIVSLTFDEVYLPVNLNGINPRRAEGYASYIDGSQDVWLGIEVPE